MCGILAGFLEGFKLVICRKIGYLVKNGIKMCEFVGNIYTEPKREMLSNWNVCMHCFQKLIINFL